MKTTATKRSQSPAPDPAPEDVVTLPSHALACSACGGTGVARRVVHAQLQGTRGLVCGGSMVGLLDADGGLNASTIQLGSIDTKAHGRGDDLAIDARITRHVAVLETALADLGVAAGSVSGACPGCLSNLEKMLDAARGRMTKRMSGADARAKRRAASQARLTAWESRQRGASDPDPANPAPSPSRSWMRKSVDSATEAPSAAIGWSSAAPGAAPDPRQVAANARVGQEVAPPKPLSPWGVAAAKVAAKSAAKGKANLAKLGKGRR